MAMTKEEADELIAGIERILSEARAAGEPAAHVLVVRGPGPGPRAVSAPLIRGMFSCPYCSATGDTLPLDHEEKCPYYYPPPS